MSCVPAEGALVQHSNGAVIREKLQLSSLAHVYQFSLSQEYCILAADFFMFPSSSGKLKRKKNSPTLQTSQRAILLSFLKFLHFCATEVQQSYGAGSLGATGISWQLQSLSCELCTWVLCYTYSTTFYFKISTLLIMCRAWQQENTWALGQSVQLPTVGSGWGE